MDKLIPLFQKRGDITNVNEGRDVTLILKAVPLPSGNGTYTTVSTIMTDDMSKLSGEETKMKEWSENVDVWTDVYSQKPVEYLEAISKGEVPEWDSNLKKYVYVNSKESSTDMAKTIESVDPQANEGADKDLPF